MIEESPAGTHLRTMSGSATLPARSATQARDRPAGGGTVPPWVWTSDQIDPPCLKTQAHNFGAAQVRVFPLVGIRRQESTEAGPIQAFFRTRTRKPRQPLEAKPIPNLERAIMQTVKASRLYPHLLDRSRNGKGNLDAAQTRGVTAGFRTSRANISGDGLR